MVPSTHRLRYAVVLVPTVILPEILLSNALIVDIGKGVSRFDFCLWVGQLPLVVVLRQGPILDQISC